MHIKLIIIILLAWPFISSAEEKEFWPYGTVIYTNKTTWNKYCENLIQYRIGKDIVACITKNKKGNPKYLVMSYAGGFTKLELNKMKNSDKNHTLPPRNHSRFKCLRVTSGWMC